MARSVLETAHKQWPSDVTCRGYLGLTLKLQGHHNLAVPHLLASVKSDQPETINSRFYFHLGDALQRLNRNDEAMEIYEKGVIKGIFRSKYQRSLYNVDRLKAKPWWTLEESTYSSFFRKLESNWRTIKSEGLGAYRERSGYLDEAESLRDIGDWKQYELFARGKKYQQNCKKTPVTCQLIEEFGAARDCRRGQVKFSVMTGGTHVWPHCGPTNCRLRAHLGLVVPAGTTIRVAQQTRTWEEGKVIIFDDSFEHEVWHNGTEQRLILIVDVWHPELTAKERASLTAI
uniref:Aspartyl/asparaginy/proline hydroxylase domain-containing protein n=1 Tax=Cuerna arida TaxID=1464854 RepID=A0A1B6FC50_9HEMI